MVENAAQEAEAIRLMLTLCRKTNFALGKKKRKKKEQGVQKEEKKKGEKASRVLGQRENAPVRA